MKQILPALMISLLLLVCSCNRNEDEIKQYLTELNNAIEAGDSVQIFKLLPDATPADSLALNYNPEKVHIDKYNEQGDIYVAHIDDAVDVVLEKEKMGTWKVIKTYGVFRYQNERLSFAKSVGQYDDDLNDVDNRARMNNQLFNAYIDSVVKQINPLKLGTYTILSTPAFGYESGKGYINVYNKSSRPVSGSDYTIVAEYLELYDTERLSYVKQDGEDIEANGSVRFEYDFVERNFPTEKFRIDYHPAPFKPTGKEYDQYVKNNK